MFYFMQSQNVTRNIMQMVLAIFFFLQAILYFFGLKFWLYIFLNLSEAIRINTAKTLIAFTSLSLSLSGMMQKKSLVRIRRELLSVN